MALIQFTRNYNDLSTDTGFQFEFSCDRCGNGYQTEFQASTLGTVTNALDAASNLFGGIFGSAANAARSFCKACAPVLEEEYPAIQVQAAIRDAQEKADTVDYVSADKFKQTIVAACPHCGAKVSGGKFCPECGKPLASEKFCKNCGVKLEASAKFCAECGTKQ